MDFCPFNEGPMVDLEESPIPELMNQLVSSNQLRGLFGKNINDFIPFPVYMRADKKLKLRF